MVRALRHLLIPDWLARRAFPPRVLERIGQAIAGSERLHRGEICFAVEGGLPLPALRASCRARAHELFALLRAWDTEENVRSFAPDWKPPHGGNRAGLAFLLPDPAAVDTAYAELTGAGYHGERPPWDAFWGQRYAVVHDPDGLSVDLFAPTPGVSG